MIAKALAIVPTYLSQPKDLEVTIDMLESMQRTEPNLPVCVIDDASPAGVLVDELEAAISRLEIGEIIRKDENEGFSRTVNVGLRRALNDGLDAVLVNADIEFVDEGWLDRMQTRTRSDAGEGPHDSDDLAGIVGAKLVYPTGLIQHAGIFFSLLHRTFGHIYQYAPQDLPEAQLARRAPVTGALQFIRHSTLAKQGVYDEEFRMGFEDVDYCIRAFLAGIECVYEPTVRAWHFESMFRGRPNPKIEDWQERSWLYFMQKYSKQSFAEFVPSLI